jgi:hypothetical protein
MTTVADQAEIPSQNSEMIATLRRNHMQTHRFQSAAVILLLSAAAFAQSDAQKTFDKMKNLAGNWQGPVTTQPKIAEMGEGTLTEVTLRVESRGNSLVHEMKAANKADDWMRNDHPVTMFYVDNDKLTLTHYCDAGNRPRMVARSSPDGKTVEFDFLDVSGSTASGHMQHALFTIIDANHHTEDWTYMMPGDKPVRAHIDLQRVQ